VIAADVAAIVAGVVRVADADLVVRVDADPVVRAADVVRVADVDAVQVDRVADAVRADAVHAASTKMPAAIRASVAVANRVSVDTIKTSAVVRAADKAIRAIRILAAAADKAIGAIRILAADVVRGADVVRVADAVVVAVVVPVVREVRVADAVRVDVVRTTTASRIRTLRIRTPTRASCRVSAPAITTSVRTPAAKVAIAVSRQAGSVLRSSRALVPMDNPCRRAASGRASRSVPTQMASDPTELPGIPSVARNDRPNATRR
jgi:hypothetical protein